MIVENLITCILHCGKFLPSIKFWDFCQINSKTVALLCGKWANVEHVVRSNVLLSAIKIWELIVKSGEI